MTAELISLDPISNSSSQAINKRISPASSQFSKRQKTDEPTEFEKDLLKLEEDRRSANGMLPHFVFNGNQLLTHSIEAFSYDQHWNRPPIENFDPATSSISK